MYKLWFVGLVVGGAAIASGCGSVAGSGGPASLVGIEASDAVMGEHGRIRVTFSNPVGDATDVKLMSTSTATATVPDHVTVARGAVSADVQYTAVASGLAVFRATAGSDVLTTTATVVDMLRVNANSTPTFEVGAHGFISQFVNITVPDAITVSLASSQPSIATVDSSLTIPQFGRSGLAQMTAVSAGASIITASYNGQQATQTVTVIAKAGIAQVFGTSLLEVGGHGSLQISLDAELANAAQLTVAPSDPSVVSVSLSTSVAPGSDFATLDFQATAVGTTNLVLSLNGSTGTLPIAVLGKAQLENVFLNGTPSVGFNTPLEVGMDVIAATAHDVALTSSDPTVVTVPPTVTVFAGTANASVAITPLKAGSAVITATYNGISRQVAVSVGSSGGGTTLSLFGQNRYVVGTIGQLSIETSTSTPTTVALVSSDPSVVSVPSSLVVNFSEAAPLTVARAGTATITVNASGATATFPVSVVASPGIQQFGPSFTVPINGTLNASMFLDTQPPVGTAITFSTSDDSVAPAPASFTLTNGQTFIPITIRGGNTGTATLTASVGAARASAVVFVGGSTTGGGFQGLFPTGPSTIERGAATILQAQFFPAPPNGDTGTITFGTAGILSTPSNTISISSNSCCNTFPVIGAVAGTSDVTLTASGVSQTVTVNVVSSATYTVSLPGSVKVSSLVTGRINSNAGVAADRTFALSSSNTAVATVTTSSVTLGPGDNSLQTSFGVRGVAAGTATISATIGGVAHTATITVQ